MDDPAANQFITFLVKSLQALCNGCIEFSSSVEVIGHIHLNIDRKVKLNYVLTEEVSKSASEDATLFSSHSYHSKPPHSQDSADSVDRAPSPPRGSSSTGTNSRRKTHQLPRVEDSEGFSFTTIPQPISVVQAETDSTASQEAVEREDTSHIPKDVRHTSDHDSPQAVASSVSGSQDRRRKSSECAFQTSATKHRRMSEASMKLEPPSPEEIILHVKGEADSGDEAVTVELSGQDITSPDVGSVMVMVPVQDHASHTKTSTPGTGKADRKRQTVEVTSVPGGKSVYGQKAGDSGQESQHQPYPIMLHSTLRSSETTGAEFGSYSSTQPGPSTISVSGRSKYGRRYTAIQLGTRGKPRLSSPPGEGSSAGQRLTPYQRKILTHVQAGTLRQYMEERVRYGKKYRHAMSAEKKQLFNAKQAIRQQQYRQRLKERKQASMAGVSAEQTEKEDRKVSKHALYMRQWRKDRALKNILLKCDSE